MRSATQAILITLGASALAHAADLTPEKNDAILERVQTFIDTEGAPGLSVSMSETTPYS